MRETRIEFALIVTVLTIGLARVLLLALRGQSLIDGFGATAVSLGIVLIIYKALSARGR